MRFEKSTGIKVRVLPEQQEFVAEEDMISDSLQKENVIGYDIFDGEQLIGFAMLCKYDDEETGETCWFLWEYAIDAAQQGKGCKLRDSIRDIGIFSGAGHRSVPQRGKGIYGGVS